MQILLLLGLVVIGASIALIYMQKGDDDKEKGFISKLLKSFMNIGTHQENSQQPTAKNEKYEKSADGKVVYIFKDKEENSEDADGTEEDSNIEDDDDSDSELPENPNPDISFVDAEVVEDDSETPEDDSPDKE